MLKFNKINKQKLLWIFKTTTSINIDFQLGCTVNSSAGKKTQELTAAKNAHCSKWQIIISITVTAKSRKRLPLTHSLTHTPTPTVAQLNSSLRNVKEDITVPSSGVHFQLPNTDFKKLIYCTYICIFCMYNLHKAKDRLFEHWTVYIQHYNLEPMIIRTKSLLYFWP